MFQANVQYERSIPGAVATQGVDVRKEFLKKTYGHLLGAVVLFIGLAWLMVSPSSPLFEAVGLPLAKLFFGSRGAQFAFLAVFILAGMGAERLARSESSRGIQYAGLAAYTLTEALFFVPVLVMATLTPKYDGVVATAALSTILIFGGLTATVFITKKDFSFIGGFLSIAMMAALALALCSWIFGFDMGLWFIVPMIGLAAGYILYSTSRVIGHFGPTQYVSAALELFAALALMFWYVLQLFLRSRD